MTRYISWLARNTKCSTLQIGIFAMFAEKPQSFIAFAAHLQYVKPAFMMLSLQWLDETKDFVIPV